ncbi:hypothetical protein BaRGS_00004294 [Batillaria attramentaria]|uniref:Uncharacterized protein n=1 Tax=Batillaria attramentaria TaxID=370345 RepID=A0ABD0LYA7_9CAEN
MDGSSLVLCPKRLLLCHGNGLHRNFAIADDSLASSPYLSSARQPFKASVLSPPRGHVTSRLPEALAEVKVKGMNSPFHEMKA